MYKKPTNIVRHITKNALDAAISTTATFFKFAIIHP